jgi:exonuclease VII small subunit
MVWEWFLPVLILGASGVYMITHVEKAQARSTDKLDSQHRDLITSLENIVRNLERLNRDKNEIPTHEMRFEIDKLFREDLNCFAESRKCLILIYNLQTYADIMSAFAAGERYINRVWSASADGYIDDVMEYLERAFEQFRDAGQQLQNAQEKAKQDGAPQVAV